MIITISGNLSDKQVGKAVKMYSPIGRTVEKEFRTETCFHEAMPKGYEIVLHISPTTSAKEVVGIAKNEPKFKVYLSAPCEIVSFEPGATMATRLVVAFGFPIASKNGRSFRVSDDKVNRTAVQLVRSLSLRMRKWA